MLHGQGVIAGREQALVEDVSQLGNPRRVEIVKNPGLNLSPIVDGHGQKLPMQASTPFYLFSAAISPMRGDSIILVFLQVSPATKAHYIVIEPALTILPAPCPEGI